MTNSFRYRPLAGLIGLAAAASASHSAAYAPGAAAQPISTRLLVAHNRERVLLGSPEMVWSPALASAAKAYADVLAATGRWEHSPARDRQGQGENLWMGTRGAFTPEQMIGAWASEKAMFQPGTFPDVSRTGSWHDVGHYTQIVWPESRAVGCALSASYRFDYLVCRYAAPGNRIGESIAVASAVRNLRQLSMAAQPAYPASPRAAAPARAEPSRR